jgi:hypothetical protein
MLWVRFTTATGENAAVGSVVRFSRPVSPRHTRACLFAGLLTCCSNGAILVYDITDEDSFEKVRC